MCVCVSVDYHLHLIILDLENPFFKMKTSLGTRKNRCILRHTLFLIRMYMRLVRSEYESSDISVTPRGGFVGLGQLRHNSPN